MTQLNDRPQYAPGDKVRIAIDAEVTEHDQHGKVAFEYPGEHGTYAGYIALDSDAVTVHRTDMDAKPISVLGFPLRISNILRRNGIHTIGALLEKRPEDLTDIRGIGVHALAEVMATLGKRGLELQETFVPLRAETVRVMAEIGDKS